MFVELILTISSVIGVIVYYWEDICFFYQKLKVESILSSAERQSKTIDDLYYMPDGLNQVIRRLIKVTLGVDLKYTVYCFWFMIILIVVLVGTITYGVVSDFLRIILMIVGPVIPLVFLLGRLQNLRVKSSKEGKVLVIELLDNYKIHYYNMQHAIEVTASTIEEAPNCKKLLFNLSKGLNRVSNNEEIKGLLEDFKYAIGTSWGGLLTDNIYFALSSGIKVDNALEDLINSISMAEEVEEKSKRENNEAGLILKYLVPICYFLTYVGGIKFFGLTPKEFLYYQFGTETGMNWFITIIIMYLLSLFARFFLTRNKLDL